MNLTGKEVLAIIENEYKRMSTILQNSPVKEGQPLFLARQNRITALDDVICLIKEAEAEKVSSNELIQSA